MVCLLGSLACGTARDSSPRPEPEAQDPEAVAAEAAEAAERARRDQRDRDFPFHALVTRPQLAIREAPERDAKVIGWLRWGERIQVKAEPTVAPRCASGWYALAPRGYACAGLGLEVGETPPEGHVAAPRRREARPYLYFLVKDRMTPQFHLPPSRSQQRAAADYAARYLDFLDRGRERGAERWLAGEIPGSERPRGVARFLNRQFWVAGTEVLVRSERRFVRTTTGGYVREAQLDPHTGSDFHGVDLRAEGAPSLPIPFVRRDVRPRERRERWDGSVLFARDMEAEVIPRHAIATTWVGRHREGDAIYHRFEGDAWNGPRYARDWFLGIAERIDAPFEVAENEHWVHIDLREQTLVAYEGTEPVYATLVSSGLEGHETPTGVFRLRSKRITDTMANLGPDAGDDSYRIQDVPYTQYFDGSFALHGALWHNRFGVRRSHGCVNLAPEDAAWVFQHTTPAVPDGWHGIAIAGVRVEGEPIESSRIYITDGSR